MIGKLMSEEEVNAALVLALSGTLVALVANGPGPVSLGWMASRALTNPIPKGAFATPRSGFAPAGRRVRRDADAR